jgi:hypothetical protein
MKRKAARLILKRKAKEQRIRIREQKKARALKAKE